MTVKSDQDPDLDPHGFELVWLLGSGSALEVKAGSGSGSTLEPMRIRSTAVEIFFKLDQLGKAYPPHALEQLQCPGITGFKIRNVKFSFGKNTVWTIDVRCILEYR